MQVCACGALVAILIQEGGLDAMDCERAPDAGPASLIGVRRVSEVALSGFLTVDQLSLQALQIFQVASRLLLPTAAPAFAPGTCRWRCRVLLL